MNEPGSAIEPSGPAVTPGSGPEERPRFPCLEGLRALAAAMVAWTHVVSLAGPANAGWMTKPGAMMEIGPTIFFGVSGFLIYYPFASAHLSGARSPRTRTYLWRRALRIFPAYWVALTVLWVGGVIDLGSDWWKFYLLLQVFDAYAFLRGIVQAWSISTEVAFYLFIPLWSLLWRRFVVRGKSSLRLEMLGVGGLLLLGYMSRAFFSWNNHLWAPPHGLDTAGVAMRQVAFSWLPNQIDFFALGMGLAVLHSWAARSGRLDALDKSFGRFPSVWWAAATAIFLYLVYFVGPPDFHVGYKGFYWQRRSVLYSLVILCLLIPAVFGDQRRGPIRGVLRLRPIAWYGTVSYAFYLWHLDLMARAITVVNPATGEVRWVGWLDRINRHVHIPGLGRGPISTAYGNTNVWVLWATVWVLGLAVAALSWYLLEKPLQRFKRVF